tara:strand:+ start:514 stop:1044 length:531 start_codon:yes stop_codon:yes gene_type:complete
MAFLLANPLGLPWDKGLRDIPQIENYKYFYGDVAWGKAVYVGQADLAEMETELVLEFAGNKIAVATLILGPSGINQANCIRKYKTIVSLMKEKYGPRTEQVIIKDPLSEDLLYVQECYVIGLGLHEVSTTWKSDKYRISSTIYGNEEGAVLIEIEYTSKLFRPMLEQHKEGILKRL